MSALIVKLGDICNIQSGGTPSRGKSEFWEGGCIPWVKISDMHGKFLSQTEEYITDAGLAASSAKMFSRGTILYTIFATLGETCILNIDATTNQAIAGISVKHEFAAEIAVEYLYYFLMSIKEHIMRVGRGVAQNNINLRILRNVNIVLPSLERQNEIVRRLSDVESILSLRQRQAEKLDELVKARFVEMFGDPVLNTKHWEQASLLALGSCKNGMSFHANESGIKLRCLGVGDFKNLSYIDDVEQLPFVSLAEKPSANCFLHDGDMVFVRSNGNKTLVGRCLLVYPHDTPTIYSGFCIRYRLLTEKVDPIYALHVLKADGIRQKMSGRGANIQNLNQKILASIEMPIPPLPLQTEFAHFVHEIDREKERIQKSAALLETLKRSLMQQYFG